MNDVTAPPMHAPTNLMEQLGEAMPIMFRLYLDPRVSEMVKAHAKEMAADTVFTPKHLRDKPAACAVVVRKAIIWNMDPSDVANGTYQPTEGGPIAYKAALINAAIAVHFEAGIQYAHHGDWSKVHNKFKTETAQSGKKYQVPTWTDKDAEGLGVEISGRLKGEREPRRFSMELAQCWPRFSTLWALDPKTQICYTALRRFTSLVAPAALMSFRLPAAEDAGEVIDMGEAEQEPGFIQPRPKPAPASEPQPKPEADVPQQQTDAPAEPAPASESQQQGEAPSLITSGQVAWLTKRLADPDLVDAFCKEFGIADPSEVPQSKFKAAQAWVNKQQPA